MTMDDIDPARSRTASVVYDGYETNQGRRFSTARTISASEKNKIDLSLSFKQYEFDKELSVYMNIPKNYKKIKGEMTLSKTLKDYQKIEKRVFIQNIIFKEIKQKLEGNNYVINKK